jgi:glycosyltransferase involved in cell wall biosynthesis
MTSPERWPKLTEYQNNPGQVTAITVSYNTLELTALLLYSLWQVLDWPAFDGVVIIDNGSTDGSRELLIELDRAGLCTLLANSDNVMHGPALNQAITYLAARTRDRKTGPEWIWVLDSDCVVVRPETLTEALAAVLPCQTAIVGEDQWDPWHATYRFGTHCLLLNPAIVWRDPVEMFTPGGDPSFELLRSAQQTGLRSDEFPFLAEMYIIHRGRGTLAAVRSRDEQTNPLYKWAADHHEPHFNHIPGAAGRYQDLYTEFRTYVPNLTADEIVAACSRR